MTRPIHIHIHLHDGPERKAPRQKMRDCEVCDGTGWVDDYKPYPCETCGCTGKVRASRECKECEGRGWESDGYKSYACEPCKGTGTIPPSPDRQ